MRVSKFSRITDDEFADAVQRCSCVRNVLLKLGYSGSSGSMGKYVKDRINRQKLSTEHFVTRNMSGGRASIALCDILVEDSTYTNIARLKGRLVKEHKLEYRCVICRNEGEWNGLGLVLQLDHINGNNRDHRIENLRFLCPNCHSQTKTYSGRNIRAGDREAEGGGL